MAITLEHVEKATTKKPGLWLVKLDGNIVGLIERFKNSRTDTHPWKAFQGHGFQREYLGAFYENGSVPARDGVQFGGKQAAINAIASRV